MFNRFEVRYYGHIACNSQCQWIVCQCFSIHSPTHKLITFICSCSQCGSCTIVIHTSTCCTTHYRVINSYCNSILNCFEVSNYGHIACDGQCQWIFSQCIFANCPTHKLITFICDCSQSCTCAIVIHTCTCYTTHGWVINSCGNSMLDNCKISHSVHIAIDGYGGWISCSSLAINGPINKLVSFVRGCG